jgi:hypothetical protein
LLDSAHLPKTVAANPTPGLTILNLCKRARVELRQTRMKQL